MSNDEKNIVTITPTLAPLFWEPMAMLRWNGPVLEQLWACQKPVGFWEAAPQLALNYEWRPVPQKGAGGWNNEPEIGV